MVKKENSNVYKTKGFCNNLSKYCLESRIFWQIKNVTITDTDCMAYYA